MEREEEKRDEALEGEMREGEEKRRSRGGGVGKRGGVRGEE